MVLKIDGLKFGRLLALEPAGSVNKKVQWRFLCDCGTTVVLAATFVKRLHTQSCGCYREDQMRDAKLVDITGQRFGMITVISQEPYRNGRARWLCRCDCGQQVIRPGKNLLNGSAVSCGCRQTSSHIGKALTPLARRTQMSVYAHKRRMAIQQAGDSFTAEQIQDLYRKQRGKCAWCTNPLGDSFHRDHRLAVSRGGDNSILNISLTCAPCNLKKRAKDEISWANEIGKLC